MLLVKVSNNTKYKSGEQKRRFIIDGGRKSCFFYKKSVQKGKIKISNLVITVN